MFSAAIRSAALATLIVGFSGCASQPHSTSTPPRSIRSKAPVSVPVTASPEAFVRAAGSFDLFVIRSAHAALRRSSNPRVRDFAAMALSAARGTSAQLNFAGRRLNLLPPNRLLPRHEALLEQLNASSDFDALYLRQQVAAHETALALYRPFAARGTSPTLRPVAASAAGIADRHLRLLRSVSR